MSLCRTPHPSFVFAMEGGLRPPQAPRLLSRAGLLQAFVVKPIIRALCLGCPPPTPPPPPRFSFSSVWGLPLGGCPNPPACEAVQACFRLLFFEPVMRALCFQMGGGAARPRL